MKREFTLPLPPSVNQLYPGKVRRHKSDAYYQWERVADYSLHKQGLTRAEWKPTTHVWQLEITCYLSDRRRDIDNTLKSGIDFIAGFFALSDNYLDEITIKRVTDKQTPRWEVRLTVPGA
jgi:Holliday junction resolvase RusA-like endonuclease